MEKTTVKLELISKYFKDFSATQLRQLEALDDLYKEWNAKINVISRKDIDSLYEKHILHSLSIAAFFTFPKGYEVLDIGTGGGFPGIPLAIFFPDTHFHLTDSIGKKIKVVESIVSSIHLSNLSTQHIRAEDIKKRQFDSVVSRAVAPLKELWNWSKGLLKKNNNPELMPEKGKAMIVAHSRSSNGLICLKGGDLKKEIGESGCHPEILDIHSVFKEEFFYEKFILFVAADSKINH
ncbi:MAG TPA: 16S rRNA (guanine(527)-N(7))-methyltransferase RsmG [Puia sp.]|nr:16S rRNA (guanine(527)-N(7))-methyltransferase RsmG [Puia sp.]